jgi:hypothetical protein
VRFGPEGIRQAHHDHPRIDLLRSHGRRVQTRP